MDKAKILNEVTEVFEDVLDEPGLKLSIETTAQDVDGWDSLSHIQLVVAIEKHFKIRFAAAEIQSWKNVGEMVDTIARRVG